MAGLLTPTDIQNISQDILDVQSWANGAVGYIQVFRLGETVPSPATLTANTNLINWLKAWNGITNYAINDAVEDSGSSYVANTANVGDQPPSVNWDLMAEKGAGTVNTVVGGTGITVDAADPLNPIANNDFPDLVSDPSPQLGEFLDANGHYIGKDKGTNIASAATIVIPTDGDYFSLTGSVTVADMTVAINRQFTLKAVAGDTFTASATIVTIDGNDLVLAAGQTVTLQSTAANVVQVVSVGSVGGAVVSGLVPLATASAAASSSIDFTSLIDGTYDAYVFYIADMLPATDAQEFHVVFSNNAGSTWLDTGTDYEYHAARSKASAATYLASASTGDAKLLITNSVGVAGTGEGLGGLVFTLFSPSTINMYTQVKWKGTCVDAAGTMISLSGSGQRTVEEAIDGVRFIMSSGNITSGKIHMFGIKTPT